MIKFVLSIFMRAGLFFLALGLYSHACQASSLSPYSIRELEELEKEFIQQINQSESVIRNPLANQYINFIGRKLAIAGNIDPPHFFLVNSKEINAFAGPGGHIGVNSQLILTSDCESELAAVMAHEMAHVRLHHLYSMIEHQKQMKIPMLASLLAAAALGVLNPTVGMGAVMASLSGFNQDGINFTRAKEKEADRIGIDMLIKAGYNPESMAQFFKKMQENSRYYYTANFPAILRTHPLDSDRIAEAQNRTAGLVKKTHRDTVDYFLFKEIIRNSVGAEFVRIQDYYEHQCRKHNPEIACSYGETLALLNANKFKEAQAKLSLLMASKDNPLYFEIAMSQAEIGLVQFPSALSRLLELQKNYPDHYAVLMAYAEGLLASDQTIKAVNILLKGFRHYQQDLPLCRTLARAQAKAHQKAYAYFTQAQCLLLEGQVRGSIAQLKVAQKLAQKDPYLLARIAAKIDEIKWKTAL